LEYQQLIQFICYFKGFTEVNGDVYLHVLETLASSILVKNAPCRHTTTTEAQQKINSRLNLIKRTIAYYTSNPIQCQNSDTPCQGNYLVPIIVALTWNRRKGHGEG
jgi:hypothetical protein